MSTSGVTCRRSSQQGACTASVCSTALGAWRRTTAATAARSVTVPTSLFTAITLTTPTFGLVRNAASSASRSTAPAASQRTVWPPTCSTAASTAWCSAAGQSTVPPVASAAPSTAVLSASVPPPVKMTSPGAQPSRPATTSRASSTAVLASRARRCEPDGLAKCSVRYGSMAATASGCIGVVAAWSR